MTVTTTQYTANSLTPHTLLTFDLPTDKKIKCEIHQVTETDTITSRVDVVHDGVNSYETQVSLSGSNTIPDEITTTIANNIGYVQVTPTSVPAIFTIETTTTEANLFSEHTRSGKIIRGDEGFGYINTGNYTIREDNNNQFGNATDYLVSNTFGPIVTGTELYDEEQLVAFAGSSIVANDDFTVFASSGQTRNCHYIEIPVIAGEVYRITANAYYTFSETYTKDVVPSQHVTPIIAVGTSAAGSEIVREFVALDTEATHTIDFSPETNTIYVAFGQGGFGSELFVRGITIKRLVPFHSYYQDTGTFFYTWNVVATGTTLLTVSNNTVTVDGSNNVFINNINCGAQSTSNRIAFSYDLGTITFSLNGAAVQSNTEYYENVKTVVFNTTPNEFSYTNEQVSNTILIELTNG